MSLSIGGIISQTFGMTMQRIGSLLGVWAVFFGLQVVVLLVMAGAVGSTMAMGVAMESPLAMGIGGMLVMFLAYIVYLLLNLAQAAALVHNASPAQDPDLGDSIMAGIRAAPSLIGLALIMFVAYIAALVVIGIVGTIFSLAGDAGSALFVIAVFLGAIYVACRLSLIFPVIAVDGVGNPITAIKRSWNLTSGHAGKIFVVVLLFAVIVTLCFLALFALMGGSMVGLMGSAGGLDAPGAGFGAAMIVFVLGFLVLMILFALVSAAFMAVLHASLAGPEAVAETFT